MFFTCSVCTYIFQYVIFSTQLFFPYVISQLRVNLPQVSSCHLLHYSIQCIVNIWIIQTHNCCSGFWLNTVLLYLTAQITEDYTFDDVFLSFWGDRFVYIVRLVHYTSTGGALLRESRLTKPWGFLTAPVLALETFFPSTAPAVCMQCMWSIE